MSEMIKRVADAIYASQFGTRMAGEFSDVDAKICARAAIEAMREPTEEMLVAGGTNYDGYDRMDVAASWPIMIDAALGKVDA